MKKFLIIIMLSLALFITGCTNNELKDNNKDNDQTDNIKEEEKEEKLKIVDTSSNTRPFAVMINNHKAAQPNHAGLQDAYLVYEIIVEGGITRMMAVFKDQTTAKIGSVRSARHYFIDYALENDAIYVHFGGSDPAYADLKSLKIEDIDGMYDGGFWRDKSLKVASEHTAFTSATNIINEANKQKYRMTSTKKLLFNYSVKPIDLSAKEGAISATNIVIPYSNYTTTKYVYDATNQVYLRYINDKPHTDGITKKQYTTKNIIVANVTNTSIPNNSKGLQELKNIGQGNGYYITNGYAVPITWNKSSRSNQTIYRYLDGTEITLNDGNTYIQIQPTSKSTTIN